MLSSYHTVSLVSEGACGLLFFPQDRGKSTYLGTQSSTNMLRGVGYQILYASHDLIKKSVPIEQGAKSLQTIRAAIDSYHKYIPGI